ncbi:alpha-beta hydrolase superfamily lysophospholipase [Pseudoxanthomonas sp. 3HH-4]|uniref:alpha/beta fold hydrolase n=1 Tax=Pseudoxanthomonas sp. 3HH-4 TaxID=1690214 RepID=UPI00116ABE52|nr:alpha/beta hydrolase [Pseudoxanthomonas sp. 3HH-4]TQM10577.1 alpha-beta hydrolase superfamily lysophospholipase [Pseudoxanthomonas sp. 3HH-4]
MTRTDRRPRLCLLPGLDGTGRLYTPLLDAFRGDHDAEVLAYDSGYFSGYAALVEALEPALRRNTDMVLIAESFAGPLAVMLAHRNPCHVRAVVLAASFVRAPLPFSLACAAVLDRLSAISLPVFALERVLAGGMLPAPLRRELDAVLEAIPIEVLRQRALAALRVDVRRQLAALDLPLLHLQARRDRLVAARAGDEIVRLARNAQQVVIDAPHFLLQLAPVAAADEIGRFLKRVCILEGARHGS